jgi:predicted DNA-binding transcriptional regulator YafY
MGRKREPDKTYGEKIIGLFARLLFSGKEHSLTELSELLGCSKQTVLRLVEDIQGAFAIPIEESKRGNRNYYRIKRPQGRQLQQVPLTGSELGLLEMCQAFARHLLGERLFEETTQALLKSQALLPEKREGAFQHFACFTPGTIDYAPYHKTILTVIAAMDAKKICKVTYSSLATGRTKTFHIQPLKLFSHGDTIYLHARKAREPGGRYKAADYDPLLAIHRIKDIEVDERSFEFPNDYDFDKAFQKTFGIIKQDEFEVEVEIEGWAAKYVAERTWSPGQKITDLGQGRIRLSFRASSEPEVIGWVLSFGEEAKVLKPDWLVSEVKGKIGRMGKLY